MPAVTLAQIKPQVTRLGLLFNQPEKFKRELLELLERSGVPSYRPGQTVGQSGIIPAFHVSPLVLQQVEQEMVRQGNQNPDSALLLSDLLWQESHLEPRLLAAKLLGKLSIQPADEIVERLLLWIHPGLGSQLMQPAFDLGTKTLRITQPEKVIGIIESWLKNPSPPHQKLGLKALLVLSEDREFLNIPAVFRLLSPALKTAHSPIHNELVDVVSQLAKRTPVETIVILRQLLSAAPTQNQSRLVRRLLPVFNPEQQTSLRELLRSIQ